MPSPQTYGCRFLELPVEILADIVELVAADRSSLAGLAMVNWECRQLARSAQFAEVCFDYSPGSHALISKLLDQVEQKDRGVNVPCIGHCIR